MSVPGSAPRRSRRCPCAALLAAMAAWWATNAPAADTAGIPPESRRVLAARCVACHEGEAPAGRFDLAALLRDDPAGHRRAWRRVAERVEDGEMPPPDEPPLPVADREPLTRAIRAALAGGVAAPDDPGPALLRRLSRDEYARTIRNLFGVAFDAAAAAGIPDESQGSGFANRADVLGLAPALMEKYFAASDAVLDGVLAATPPPPPRQPKPAPKPQAAAGLAVHYRCAGAKADDNQIRAVVQLVNAGPQPVPLADLTIRYWFTADGLTDFQHWCDYAAVDARHVRLAVRPLDKPVAGADACVEIGFDAGVVPPAGSSGDVQVRVAARDWAAFDQANDHSFDPAAAGGPAPRITLHRGGRLVWGIEPTGEPVPAGPVAPQPTPDMVRAWERVFFVQPGGGLSARAAATRILTAFARRAWRRPVAAAEVRGLVAIFDRAAAAGAPFQAAVRPALGAVLVSPHFLYRVERDEPAAASSRPVDDHELAVRLSYFLWSSMPDDALFQAADRGELGTAAAIERQVRRMLADPKATALTENFGKPWLQLGKLATARPTPEFFPEFTPALRDAMLAEATAFLENLRREDRSLLDLVDADYTFVNDALARHYGLPDPGGAEFRRVALRPEDHRGGVLGMAAVLATTSHTFRTSPTLRGRYVLEVLLGAPPPPPPPDAGVLADDPQSAPPATFRESLERHARDPACAACHARIDPLGFGLEPYDGIGRWRDAAARGIDASGRLPGGESFSGPAELKAALLRRKSRFLRHASAQMLAYALGRPLEECDEPALDAITAAVERDGGRFSTLVVEVAGSVPFRHRRTRPAEPAGTAADQDASREKDVP